MSEMTVNFDYLHFTLSSLLAVICLLQSLSAIYTSRVYKKLKKEVEILKRETVEKSLEMLKENINE